MKKLIVLISVATLLLACICFAGCQVKPTEPEPEERLYSSIVNTTESFLNSTAQKAESYVSSTTNAYASDVAQQFDSFISKAGEKVDSTISAADYNNK